MDDFKTYKRRIISALRNSGLYDKNLTIQIENLATSLWTLSMCRREMEDEDFKVIEIKKTRDGSQPIENPIFKVVARTQADISRQMKQLNLTVEDIVGKPDTPIPLDELDEEMKKF